MNVHDEFTRRVAADRLCRELARAIAENDMAALERLGMRGFGRYAGRLSELMTDSVRLGLIPSDDFGEIMRQVNSPARYAHHLVNEGGSAIQQALDERNGVRLRVIEPEFNDGRLKGIVGEASGSDSENAADNLAVHLGTMTKDAGNEFMRQNAEQRDRAGFKVTITRTGGAKCCPWCADRTGTWTLENAPAGVFGVHDNCKCMVDYTNSKGTVRGKAVGKKWNFSEIPYEPPRVLTREEAAARGGFSQPRRLTGGANGDIISALSIDNFREADPEGKISEECFDTIIETLKAQKQLYGYNSVRVVDIPPDENNRYEVMRTNAIATPRYPVVILELNRRFFGGRSKAEIDEFIRLQHYSVANSLEEAVIHECGHLKVIGDKSYSEYEAIDKELKGRAFTAPIKGRKDGKSLRDIAAEISPYAQKDGLECIAESEVILSRGETLSEDLQKLYDKYVK